MGYRTSWDSEQLASATTSTTTKFVDVSTTSHFGSEYRSDLAKPVTVSTSYDTTSVAGLSFTSTKHGNQSSSRISSSSSELGAKLIAIRKLPTNSRRLSFDASVNRIFRQWW